MSGLLHVWYCINDGEGISDWMDEEAVEDLRKNADHYGDKIAIDVGPPVSVASQICAAECPEM